jgi:hypothetical protein
VTLDAKSQRDPTPAAGGWTVPLRPCLGALALVSLALAMNWTTRGFAGTYAPVTITAVLTAGLLAIAACVLPPRAWRFPPVLGRLLLVAACLFLVAQAGYRVFDRAEPTTRWEQANPTAGWVKAVVGLTALAAGTGIALSRRAPASFPAAVLAALALVLGGSAVFCTSLRSPPFRPDCLLLIALTTTAGFVLTASLLVHLCTPDVRWRRLFAGQVVLLFVAGAALRFAAALVAPEPDIDVYRAHDQGAGFLLRGENPYAGQYVDPDGDEEKGSPFYPPLPILVSAPFKAVGLDVRLGNAACDVLAALALLFSVRGNRLLGSLLAVAWLNFPIAPFVVEVAWYEPMVAAALGLGVVLSLRGWRLGYFLLGVGLSGKQYGVVLLPALLKGMVGRRLAVLLGTAAAGVLIVLPFYLWGPQSFYDRVVGYHLGLEMRSDALTVLAAAKNAFDVELPRSLARYVALALIGAIALRAPSRGVSPAPWMAASLLVFCLFHNQAFPNYFYLCAYLMLLGLGDWLVRDAAPDESSYSHGRLTSDSSASHRADPIV